MSDDLKRVRHSFPLSFLWQLSLDKPRFFACNFLVVGILAYFCSYRCVIVARM